MRGDEYNNFYEDSLLSVGVMPWYKIRSSWQTMIPGCQCLSGMITTYISYPSVLISMHDQGRYKVYENKGQGWHEV